MQDIQPYLYLKDLAGQKLTRKARGSWNLIFGLPVNSALFQQHTVLGFSDNSAPVLCTACIMLSREKVVDTAHCVLSSKTLLLHKAQITIWNFPVGPTWLSPRWLQRCCQASTENDRWQCNLRVFVSLSLVGKAQSLLSLRCLGCLFDLSLC